jgi:hypothetical protein
VKDGCHLAVGRDIYEGNGTVVFEKSGMWHALQCLSVVVRNVMIGLDSATKAGALILVHGVLIQTISD